MAEKYPAEVAGWSIWEISEYFRMGKQVVSLLR